VNACIHREEAFLPHLQGSRPLGVQAFLAADNMAVTVLVMAV